MRDQDRIQPFSCNPFYWQYKGKPVLLLGGSVEDNLFQIPHVKDHLDLLESVGGNYVRCTMSSRDEGDVWPFRKDQKTALYDLNKPGEEYWRRFQTFLDLAAEREIIVQTELWDRFDFARSPWLNNPYNPKNNLSYTAKVSGLKEEINTHPGRRENDFFRSVPSLENNEVVLQYQHGQVDKMLSISLQYDNVLYCMDNETNESPEWGRYWSEYIKARAIEAGVEVETTEMWDAWDLADPQHNATLDHPDTYSFVDISQNNHQPADRHWENAQGIRRRIISTGKIRPMNSVKIYGANSGRFGSTRDGQERFWRNIFGGLASSRFHRPPSGLGLNEIAQAHIRSMRMLTNKMDIFNCEPHNDLLRNRSWNEAYCTANLGIEYAVFFPDGGNVLLDVSAVDGKSVTLNWLDIRKNQWSDKVSKEIENVEFLQLITPTEEGYWVALIKAQGFD